MTKVYLEVSTSDAGCDSGVNIKLELVFSTHNIYWNDHIVKCMVRCRHESMPQD